MEIVALVTEEVPYRITDDMYSGMHVQTFRSNYASAFTSNCEDWDLGFSRNIIYIYSRPLFYIHLFNAFLLSSPLPVYTIF